MNDLFRQDYEKFSKRKFSIIPCVLRIIKNYELRFLFILRKNQSSNSNIYNTILNHYMNRYGIEINSKKIGGGLQLIHPWGITVNTNAILGINVTLFKGCTIVVIETGKKQGNPNIGDNVTIYANATVCGNIKIGNNSVIASNSFVNFDVPDNSIVIGNPGKIYKKTEGE